MRMVVRYHRRIVDDELDELMSALPAVSLQGPKGVGKTATALRRSDTVFRFDDPGRVELFAASPEVMARSSGTILIDEWQRWPSSWDQVRRAVDDGAHPGRFLLTGSASPTTAPTHSGAGRIVSVRMRPQSLVERRLVEPTVSLSSMLSRYHTEVSGQSALTVEDYTAEIVRSGFPGVRPLSDRAARSQLDGYLQRIVEHDFPEQGHLVRRPNTLTSWLRAYAAATSSTVAYGAILDAATPGDAEKPAKTTTIGYRDVLAQLWLLDPVPGWIPAGSGLNRLAQAPKHHLADPALAARLLGLDADSLMAGVGPGQLRHGQPMLGALFESLITQSVRVYAQAAEAELGHLRTRNGDHEVDLVVHTPAGRVVALEVKLAGYVQDADVRHLRWLRERLGDQLSDCAVITTGTEAYRRPDGIAVIPAALLGP